MLESAFFLICSNGADSNTADGCAALCCGPTRIQRPWQWRRDEKGSSTSWVEKFLRKAVQLLF